MSVSLTLTVQPPTWGFAADRPLGYTRLGLQGQDYGLWSALRSIATPTNGPVLWYSDDGLRESYSDAYGAPITAADANEIASIMARYSLGPWDLAIVAFLYALPAGTRVILWWH